MSEANATAMATARTPGFDVARALAVLGMVIVNYRGRMEPNEDDAELLVWLADRFEGRAAALFVVLAGVGISLRSRRARSDASLMGFERGALLKRAAVLAVAGFLNLHLWEWDILHFYAVFLAFAALLLSAPGWLLWLLSCGFVGGQVWLEQSFAYDAELDVFSIDGLISDLFFNGLHPVFPWMVFLLLGMWLGRLDLRSDATRNKVLVASLAAMFVGEWIDTIALQNPEWLGLDDMQSLWLTAWPRPPRPLYMITATGTAVASIALCISVTQPRPRSGWVVALAATGQLAFTLYIAHAIVIVIPQMHGLFEQPTLAISLFYSFAFYLAAIAASVWWRRRFAQGPLEGLIRQITSRTTPAPWGGELMGAGKE